MKRSARGKLGERSEDGEFMPDQPEGNRKFGQQCVDVLLQRLAVGAAELAETGNRHDSRRPVGAKEGRAGVDTYNVSTRAALVCIF